MAIRNSTFRSWGAIVIASVVALTLTGCADSVERFIEQAKAHRASGDYVAAEIEIRNALRDSPKNVDALLLAGQIFADLEDFAAAEETLRRALQGGSTQMQVIPTLARVLVEMEKFPEALEMLKLEGKPDPAAVPLLTVLRGRAYLGTGAILEARTEFNVSWNMQPSAAPKLGLAQLAMVERDRPAAERLVGEALEADPKSVDAFLLRAQLLRQNEQFDDAAAAYGQALKLEPKNFRALAEFAALYLVRGNNDAAQPLLQQAEKLAPKSPRVRYARAALALNQKRYENAISELLDLLKDVPKHAPGMLLMGIAQYADGKYDRAQIAFVDYLKRFPQAVPATRMLAATLLAKGQPHLAAAVIEPLVRTGDPGIFAIAGEANRQIGRLARARALLQHGLKLNPKNPDLLMSLARTDLASGARERGIAGLESVIELEPDDSRADHTLIFVLLGQNEVERAERAASALAKRRPAATSTYVLQGAVQISKKDFAGARASFERALQLDPRNLDAVEAMADVDSAEKKPDRRRERLSAILAKDDKHTGAWLALARLDLAQGQQAESVASIRRALAEQPQSGNALLTLADLQFRNGEIEQAMISARQAHELHPYDTRAIAALGQAQMAAGDLTGAIVTLTKLTVLQPAVASGYVRLAAAQLAAGDLRGAEATMLTALQKEPKDRSARGLLADIYLREGELDRAQALAAQVQKEDPKDALGYRIEGDVLFQRKDYARAFEAYKKAAAGRMTGVLLVKMHQVQRAGRGGSVSDEPLRAWVGKNPDDLETRYYMAEITAEAGRHKEAADQYREILRREPNSARALNNLAWALHAAGDQRAVEYAKQAVDLAPKSAVAVDTLGWILLGQGNVAEGVPALLKAVSLDGNDPEIRYHLVQGLLKIGDDRRAREELRLVLASDRPFSKLVEARVLSARLGL